MACGVLQRLVGNPNTTNWCHFAIPTTVIVDNVRKKIGRVMLRFNTGSLNAVVRDVHVYDGENQIAKFDNVNLSTNHPFEHFDVGGSPELQWGLGISIGVSFLEGISNDRRIEFIAAGCDFQP
jgi:hypothetical protein